MHQCPIVGCPGTFYTRHSLVNHLRKSVETNHAQYYKDNVVPKKCKICWTPIDNRKRYRDLCPKCTKENEPKREEHKSTSRMVSDKKCYKCGNPAIGFFSVMNTRVLCPSCRQESEKNETLYRKQYTETKNALEKENRRICREEGKKELVQSLSEDLRQDVVNFDLPVSYVLKKYHVSFSYFKMVSKIFLSDEEYKKRVWNCRHNGGLKVATIHKKRWRSYARPSSPFFSRSPNKLEHLFGEQIRGIFPQSTIRYNVWKTLKDDTTGQYLHMETDIVVEFSGIRVCVLCDGNAFHGSSCHFRGNTVDEDEWKSQLLHVYNPHVLRYSEKEIKSGSAIADITGRIHSIESGNEIRSYRNWMLVSN